MDEGLHLEHARGQTVRVLECDAHLLGSGLGLGLGLGFGFGLGFGLGLGLGLGLQG